MKISARVVNKKRHTLGYVLNDGQTYTRNQTVKLVRTGKVDNARVIKSPTYGNHLMGMGRSLYSLPTRIATGSRIK